MRFRAAGNFAKLQRVVEAASKFSNWLARATVKGATHRCACPNFFTAGCSCEASGIDLEADVSEEERAGAPRALQIRPICDFPNEALAAVRECNERATALLEAKPRAGEVVVGAMPSLESSDDSDLEDEDDHEASGSGGRLGRRWRERREQRRAAEAGSSCHSGGGGGRQDTTAAVSAAAAGGGASAAAAGSGDTQRAAAVPSFSIKACPMCAQRVMFGVVLAGEEGSEYRESRWVTESSLEDHAVRCPYRMGDVVPELRPHVERISDGVVPKGFGSSKVSRSEVPPPEELGLCVPVGDEVSSILDHDDLEASSCIKVGQQVFWKPTFTFAGNTLDGKGLSKASHGFKVLNTTLNTRI